jgi:hypothetical protein
MNNKPVGGRGSETSHPIDKINQHIPALYSEGICFNSGHGDLGVLTEDLRGLLSPSTQMLV